MAMKILYLLGEFPVLSQTFIHNEIIGLIDLGHEVNIISLKKPSDYKYGGEIKKYDLINKTRYLEFSLEPSAVKVIETYSRKTILKKGLWELFINQLLAPVEKIRLFRACYDRKLGMKIALKRLLRFLSRYSEVIKVIKKKKIDIIYCHFGQIGRQFAVLKEILRIPFVTYFHGYDFSDSDENKGYAELFKNGDRFFTNSNYSRKRIVELGCAEDKIAVLGYGVDMDRFRYKKRAIQDKINLLTVARLVEKKGIEYSIMAVQKSIRKHPNITYNIIGEGALRPRLEELIKKENTRNNIFLLGGKSNEEVLKYMLDSHVFILSSVTASSGDTEGLAVVLLEAQATGMPVIATLHNGFLDSVSNGKSGFLVPEKDVEAITEKVNYLIEHPGLLEEMGKEGRRHVLNNYEKSRVLDRLIREFTKLKGTAPFFVI